MSKIQIHIEQTNKFKTVRVQLSFLSQPSKKEMAARAVLINMLKQESEDYPSKASLLNHLHERYNMRLSALPSKIGRVQMLSFTVDFIHSDYTLEENDMFIDAIDLLESLIKRPKLSEKLFLQEKRILEEYFASIYADKSHYAVHAMLKHMYDDPFYYMDGLGDVEDVKNLTYEDIKKAYQSLYTDQIVCTVHGQVDEDRVKRIINERFKQAKKTDQTFEYTLTHKVDLNRKRVVETQTIKQTNLVLGLDFPVYFNEEDYFKARFFNVILGGHSESILFKEIREKRNMAYYISSSYNPYLGLMVIQTGIDGKNKELVIKAIEDILKDLQEGKLSEAIFTQSKNQLKNALIQSQDSQARMTSQKTLQSIFGLSFSLEDRLEELNTISKEDMAEIAKKLHISTIFALTGEANA